jgi:desulfoferrodoxin (superoxide reductase-like protein)
MIRLVISLAFLASLSRGFVPAGPLLAPRPSSALFAEKEDHPLSLSSAEIDRRAALVSVAVLAAGASRAVAATIEEQVKDLETTNIAAYNSKGDPEKHLPQVTLAKEGGSVEVTVPHVMDPEKPHYIEFIWLTDTNSGKVVAVRAFKPTDPSPPTLIATKLEPGTKVQPFLFCNLHGVWQGDPVRVVIDEAENFVGL